MMMHRGRRGDEAITPQLKACEASSQELMVASSVHAQQR
jgi:hypothetical protein